MPETINLNLVCALNILGLNNILFISKQNTIKYTYMIRKIIYYSDMQTYLHDMYKIQCGPAH